MPIKHFYSQTVADGTATSVVRPSDWNSNHSMIYNLSGNTLGSSQIGGADVTFVGGDNMTLSADTAASKLVFVGPGDTRGFFDNLGPLATASGAMGGKAIQFRTVWFAPLEPFAGKFDADMTMNTFALDLSLTNAANSISNPFSSTFRIGIYTINSTAATLSMGLINSVQTTFGFAAAATNNSTAFAGQRYLTIHSSQWSSQPVFTQGGRYVVGLVVDTAGNTNTVNSVLGGYMNSTNARQGYIGNNIAAATWQGAGQFIGHYSATSTGLPTAVNYTQVNKQAASANFVPHIIAFNYTNVTL